MNIIKPKNKKKGAVMTAAAIGSAVGAGVAMLYTTKKGKALRANASKKVSKVSSNVTSVLKHPGEAGRKVSRVVRKAGSIARKRIKA
jgi:gas vesicle protein